MELTPRPPPVQATFQVLLIGLLLVGAWDRFSRDSARLLGWAGILVAAVSAGALLLQLTRRAGADPAGLQVRRLLGADRNVRWSGVAAVERDIEREPARWLMVQTAQDRLTFRYPGEEAFRQLQAWHADAVGPSR